jgi:hypothetical protein
MKDEVNIFKAYKKTINENSRDLGFRKFVDDQKLQDIVDQKAAAEKTKQFKKKFKREVFKQKYFPTLSKAPGKFKRAFSKAMSSNIEMDDPDSEYEYTDSALGGTGMGSKKKRKKTSYSEK